MDESPAARSEVSAHGYSPASAQAIEMPAIQQPLREPSPLRPLLIWLGAPLAIANLSLFPCFVGMVVVVISVAFSGGKPPPRAAFWLPVLTLLTQLLAGLVPAQAFLATLCFTWSQGDYWRRFVQHWLVVLASAGTLLGGMLLFSIVIALTRAPDTTGNWYGGDDELAQTILGTLAVVASLPMVLLAVQLPFWFARHFLGCRLVRATDAVSLNSATQHESLALRDLFVATALIAVSLGLLQFSDRLNAEQGHVERAYLFAMLLFAAICGGVSCIAALPLAVLFFRCRSLWFAWGVALAAAGIDSLVVFAIGELWSPTPNPLQSLGFYLGLFYSFTCGSAAGLTILRCNGWRMASRWSLPIG